ncbi:MAG: cytochrome c peroxidase, partial [Bacteroidia bacterium]
MPLRLHFILRCVVVCLLLTSCGKDVLIPNENIGKQPTVPYGFPAIAYPADNAYTLARWELGKKLFFDPVLSVDSSLSCGSCHKPNLAFSDELATTPGVFNRPGTRNAPTLANVAYHPYFTREGGVPTLEMQVLVPLQEHNEFDFNIVDAGDRLAKIPDYIEMSLAAYNRKPDYYVITRALANFERSFLSGNSTYDQYIRFGGSEKMTAKAKLGADLFFSNKTNCSSCHSGFDFTNYSFENNGLYTEYSDPGRMRLTGKEEDAARFKVPSLRNVAVTGPYMHDGSIQSLEAVIEHYNLGGKNHPNKSAELTPLALSKEQKIQLLAFLESLTDEEFIT